MKILILLTFLFYLGSPSKAQANALSQTNGLIKFLMEQRTLQKKGLATLLGQRCQRYLVFRDQIPCKNAVKRMLDILDFDLKVTHKDWPPKSFVFVAFRKNLISLLESSLATTYLNEINSGLYRFLLDSNDDFDLWKITLKHYKNPYHAAMAVAALFQDISSAKLHLGYLEFTGIRGRGNFEENKELLNRVIDTINLVLDIPHESARSIFYPRAIYRELNRNIYHYYVPMFLSMSMARNGMNKKLAFKTVFLLTLTYEFITSANDYRYLVFDPLRINPTEDLSNIRDIYAGFSGARFGAHNSLGVMPDFNQVVRSFSQSTSSTVKALLKY